MLFCTVYPAKMKLCDSFSIAHPPEKRKAFFVNKRACRAKGARRAARFAVLSTESGSFRAPASQEPTSNKKPPLPRRNPQGGKKTAPAAPDRDSITQPIQNCKEFSSYIHKYKQQSTPPPQENSCGGGHSDTFLRVRKQSSVIPSLSRDLSRMC